RLTPVTSTFTWPPPRSPSGGWNHLPRRRRWTRVLRSSLRCFFLAMRLRRFLTTEPIRRSPQEFANWPPAQTWLGVNAQPNPPRGRTLNRPVCPSARREHRRRSRRRRYSRRESRARSGGLGEGPPEVLVHGMLRDPERPAHPYRRQLSGVYQPIDGHLRHPHQRSHLGDREELDLCQPARGLR